MARQFNQRNHSLPDIELENTKNIVPICSYSKAPASSFAWKTSAGNYPRSSMAEASGSLHLGRDIGMDIGSPLQVPCT